MREILRKLNEETSAAGSMVITPDGIMVSAALGQEFEEDSMAAFASSLLLSVKRCLTNLNARSTMKSCKLTAAAGQVHFFDMNNSYLVVVADPSKDVEADPAPIECAIQQITSRRIA